MSPLTAPPPYPPSVCDEIKSLTYASISPPSTAGTEGGRERGKEGERGRGRGRGREREGERERVWKRERLTVNLINCYIVYAREMNSDHQYKT